MKCLFGFVGLSAVATCSWVSSFAVLVAETESEWARIERVTRPTTSFSQVERFELRPGGAATVIRAATKNAFSHPSANMPFERQLDFKVGNGIFKKVWVSSPSSTRSSDGLGPLFNARACQRCHLKDGRGHPPEPGERAESMVLQLSIQPRNADELAALRVRRKAGAPEPTYGGQLQNFSIQNIRAEGEMTISYQEVRVLLADDEMVFLRQPTYGIAGLHYGPLHPDTTLSARIAPPIIGMGLLEAIPESDILEHADPHDSNGDGISGRPNQVWSDQLEHVVLGRFGWKAGQPTIAQQAANAFQKDMGISTPIYANPYGDCTETQNECLSAAHGGPSADNTVEAGAKLFELLEFYARNLGVPARRDVGDTQVLKGKQLFYESNCVGCHVPKFVTRRDSIGEEQSFQLIWPYTDLLLHDMGEGLADSRPEGEATGREWRTPPLWGIGLTQMVSGHTRFLHDGRARNLLEAVIWHGGEAEAARQHVIQMTKEERAALLTFLGSL